jgi:4a-hydroxytetrahydrobiopterin dehydratase
MKGEKNVRMPSANEELRISDEEAARMALHVPDWHRGEKEIEREFRLADFRTAVEFVDRVADLAEEEDHHPDIFLSYNKVRLVLSTHKAGGLSRKDFLLAAKIDRLAEREM